MADKITIDELARMSQKEFSELHKEVNGVRSELTEKIDGVRGELTDKIDGVRSELIDKIVSCRLELKGEVQSVRNELHDFRRKVLTGQDQILTILNKLDTEITSLSSANVRHEKQIAELQEKVGIAD